MPTSDHTTSVEYRELGQHPGYRFGSDGSVWSRWRRKSLGYGRGAELVVCDQWRRLKCGSDRDGYRVTHLRTDRLLRVHALILDAFAGPRPAGKVCRHLDGNRANNAIENLAWGTPQENNDDKVRHGTDKITSKGELHGSAKLTIDDVIRIRERAERGESLVAISRDYPVHENTIGRIVARKRWAHV